MAATFRRVVRTPEGSDSLVLIRPAVAKLSPWSHDPEIAAAFQGLSRLIRRDRRWYVEVYVRIKQDRGETPQDEPARQWVLADCASAEAFAESLARQIALHGAGVKLE